MTKLFQKFNTAVKAMALCCDGEDASKSPVAKSEVYNETWMLRMTLAAIHDHEGEFGCADEVLDHIRRTVRVRWISEGGLEPVFEHEGPTWTDAIIGDVKLGDRDKRKVHVVEEVHAGIVIIEAKMGSELSTGVTNSKDYDQFARNIACLAKLLIKSGAESVCERSRVVVIGPDKKWTVDPNGLLEKVIDTIKAQGYKRAYRDGLDENVILRVARKIKDNSRVVTWEDVINALDGDVNRNDLAAFYDAAKSEM